MTGHWRCSNGHHWEVSGSQGDRSLDESACPQCGAPSVFQEGADLPPFPPSIPLPPLPPLPPQGETTVDFSPVATSPALQQVPGYEILEELGHGGMGVVYKALHIKLKRVVALKMILAGPHARKEDLERFRIEAEAVARLQHPNIVQIHEVGEHNGAPFFSLEYCTGGSLAKALQGNAVQPMLAAQVVETLARAMQHAHRQRIIHRDLKPANILLQISDCRLQIDKSNLSESSVKSAIFNLQSAIPKIADFGLAKQLDDAGRDGQPGVTASGVVMGTPSYMAPEQAEGKTKQLGPAVDIYALGAILYELLTGRPPFRGPTHLDTILQVINHEPVPPSRLQPGTPPDLETICLKCLQKQAAKRYATAEDLADDLQRFQAHEPIKARPVGRLERGVKWVRRNPTFAALTAAVALALLTASTIAVVFAFSEAENARRSAADADTIGAKQKETEDALKESMRQEKQAKRRAAELLFEQAHARCVQEDASRGTLWLAQALYEVSKLEAPEVEHSIRLQLDGWRRDVHRLRSVLEHEAQVQAVAFSRDGKTVLTGSQDNTARLWEAATGKPIGPPLQHQKEVVAVAFSPDGKRVLTGSQDKTARLWEAATGKPMGPPLQHKSVVQAVAFSPDGKTLLTGSWDKTARVWETATGKLIGLPLLHQNFVLAVAFSPDGKSILTVSQDNTAQLWETATGKPIGPPLQHQDHVVAVAFSPDGKRVLTGSQDKTARLWEAATGKPIGPPLQHQDFVLAVAFSHDSKTVLTGSYDKTARLWEAATGKRIGPPLQHQDILRAVTFSPDGKTVLTGSTDKSARLWEAATGKPIEHPLQPQGLVWAMAFSPDGKTVLTGSHDKTARLWEAATGNPIGPPLQHQKDVFAVAFSPDGKSVLTGSHDKTAQLWEAATSKPIGPPMQHQYSVDAVAFSPDGKMVLTGSSDSTARLWEAATGKRIGPPLQDHNTVRAVAFSPDGRTVLTGSDDKTARLWEAAMGKPSGPPLQHQSWVTAVAFSPDGKTVLTGSDDSTARLWETATGKSIGPPLQHQNSVKAVAFSPNGKTVLTGSDDNTARLWETGTGKPIGPPLQHQRRVQAVAFAPDGKTVLTGSYDKTARWPAPAALPGDPERLLLWAQVITGMELEQGALRVLDARTWEERRRRLDKLGGPPVP